MTRIIYRWQSLLLLSLLFGITVLICWFKQPVLEYRVITGYASTSMAAALASVGFLLGMRRFKLAEERRPWQCFLLATGIFLLYQLYAIISLCTRHPLFLPWSGIAVLLLTQGLLCSGLLLRTGRYPKAVFGKCTMLCDVLLAIAGVTLIVISQPVSAVMLAGGHRVMQCSTVLGSIALLVCLVLAASMAVPRGQQSSRLVLLAGILFILVTDYLHVNAILCSVTSMTALPILLGCMGFLVVMTAQWCEISHTPKEATDACIVEEPMPILGLLLPFVLAVGALFLALHHDNNPQSPLIMPMMASVAMLAVCRMLFTLFWNRQSFADMGTRLRESERLGMTDALTGVPNKRACMQRLDDEVARSVRYKRPLALIFSDIDFFKLINDVHGHHVGDLALCAVAHILQNAIRSTDMIARLGGEEFVLILPETTLAQASLLADRLRKKIEDHRMPLQGGDTLQMTISLGVSACPETSNTVDKLLEDADAAMNHAKETGRNRVVNAQATQRFFVVDQR
ncbi:MAG TPA: GGDEF domain-containing protein [Armatimonadota bacterium]|nr:GGDEF domain-containing protein [Armatimonadota bacterium]